MEHRQWIRLPDQFRIQLNPFATTAVAMSLLATGIFHENTPHRLSRCGEEVPAMIEALIGH